MKRNIASLLTVLSLVFASLCCGFYVGRNLSSSPVQVTYLQKAPTQSANPEPAQTEATVTFPVNINTANRNELMALPGIGEVLSQRILDYREKSGPFESVAELINVEGIGEDRLEELLSYATIGG